MEGTDALKRVAQIVGQPEQRLSEILHAGVEPTLLRDLQGEIIPLSDRQAEEINRLKLPGIIVLPVTERYRPDELAKHVIGYLHQNPELIKTEYREEWESGKMGLNNMVGASGLERSFDRFLQGVEPSTLSYFVDGQGNPLRGLNIRYTSQQTNQFYPLSLITTLDRDIQRQMEQIADENLQEGAIVVLDAHTGDVIAMVSRPTYDQNHVRVTAGEWKNRAVKQLPPGSVFKTVIAAAALAEDVVSPTERFHCSGEYGKYGFSCWKKDGHGSITLDEAFAQSCNIAFAEIAKRLGPDKIEEYAARLGLTVPVGHETPQLFALQNFRQIDGEETGRVFAAGSARSDEGVLIQTAIGQRDVRITPLQAANMMVTILRGGQPGQVRLVSDIAYRNGSTFHHFSPELLPMEGIDPVTARKLTRLLRNVVTSGTGRVLQDAAWETAGKSGTAEVQKNGATRNHHWFVGYAPVKEPRYAVAVVAENRPEWAENGAAKLFSRVIGALASRQSGKSAESPAANR
jgi:cell division protein FtsI/penicillin-binding protein 2